MSRAPRNVNAALTQSRTQGSLWSSRPALRESWVRGCHALSPSFHAGLIAVIVCRGVHQWLWRSILVNCFKRQLEELAWTSFFFAVTMQTSKQAEM